MCRLLIMSGLDPKKKELNWKFIIAMGEAMSQGNDDGLGYTAINKKGNLFGERWLYNWQAFDNRNKFTNPRKREHEKFAGLKDMVKEFINLEDVPDDTPHEKYNNFGVFTDEITAITLHTRMATSARGLINTHPFVDLVKETSLVHNGVIWNHAEEDKIRSTCDSERLLNKYLEHEIAKVPADIQNMIDDLRGYFACGVFSLNRDGKRVLDVFKSRADLSGAIIKELGCLVLSTKLDDIKKVAAQCGMTIVSKQDKVKEDTLIRFDALTGKVLLTQSYRDTARWESTTTSHGHHGRHYNRHSGNMGIDPYGTNWENELAAYDRRATEQSTVPPPVTNNVVSLPNKTIMEVLTEDQKREVIELQKASLAEDEILFELTKKNNVGSISDEVKKQIKEILTRNTEVNNIIDKHSVDKLNEKGAALDGWYQTAERDAWIKKSGVKH